MLLSVFATSVFASDGVSHIYDIENVSSLRVKSAALKSGKLEKTLNIGFFGDSYVDGNYYPAAFYNYLIGKYVNGGVGYVSFASTYLHSTSVNPPLSYLSYSGTVSRVGSKGYGPDAKHSFASKGTLFSIDLKKIATTSVNIIYATSVNGGTFSYSADGGNLWTSVDTAGSSAEVRSTVDIDTSKTVSFLVRVDSGRVCFVGANVKNDVPNSVRIHKFGNSGACASRFVDKTGNFAKSVAVFNLDAAFISFGVNDAGNSNPDEYETSLCFIAEAVRVSNKNIALIFMFPPSVGNYNPETNPERFNRMKARMKKVAAQFGGAFVDMSEMFNRPNARFIENLNTDTERLVRSTLIKTDKIHPSTLGSKFFFNTLMKVVFE